MRPLDIETIAALAPKATIDVYQAPNKDGGFYDIFKKWVTTDTDRVLSVSWGNCEARTSTANARAQEALFEQANAQGQTVFAAAGDNGSTGCSTDATPDARVSAFSPASEPYVIGVGGTSFDFTNNNDLVATRGYDMATGLGAPMVAGLSGVYGSGHGLWYTFLTGLSRARTVPPGRRIALTRVLTVPAREASAQPDA